MSQKLIIEENIGAEEFLNNLLPCPFAKVEKELGHKPYLLDVGGLWHVQCTCGARGPISATPDCAAKAWQRVSKI